jgi:hypothetical protein
MASATDKDQPLRRKRPTASTTPGAGHVDEIAQMVETVHDSIDQIPTDEFTNDLKPPLVRAANAAETCRRDLWDAQDRIYDKLARANDLITDLSDAAARAVPTSGHSSPQDYELKVTAARSNVEAKAATSARNEVITTRGEDMKQHATEFAQAMGDASGAIDWASARFLGPAALRPGFTIEDIQRIGATVAQIKGHTTPMRYACDYLDQVSRNGDQKTIDLFSSAAREVAIEWRDTPEPKLAARYANRRGVVDDERSRAWDLLRALDDLRRAAIPASIPAATNVLAALAQAFGIICGLDPRRLAPAEFARRYLDADTTKPAPAFEIDPNFVSRYLPPEGSALSGWSPGVARTQLGGIARTPLGGRKW